MNIAGKLLIALGATVLLSACGGSSSDSANNETAAAADPATTAIAAGDATPTAATTNSPDEATTQAVTPQTACQALTPEQVTALLGRAATGEPQSSPARDNAAFDLDACTWGSIAEGDQEFVTYQIFTPGSMDDPLRLLLSSSADEATPVPELPDGQYYPVGLMPGGGGNGGTAVWKVDGKQYTMSLLAQDVTEADKQNLIQTARSVAGQ